MNIQFTKGYGYWDLTKHPYGGDFKRFTGEETGEMIKGETNTATEIKVKLNDSSIIITEATAVQEAEFLEILEIFEQINKIK